MTDIKRKILKKVYLIYFGILLLGLAIIGKAIHIQFIEGGELIDKAKKQELKYFTIKAVRGNIYSADGYLLATSIPIFEIRMDVGSPLIPDNLFNDKIDHLANDLSDLFTDRPKNEYKKILVNARKKGNRYLLIKRHVTYAQLKKLRDFPILRRGKNKGGLIIIPKTRRKIPFEMLAKRTIGFENRKEKLFVGLEGAYSEILGGTDGKQLKRKLSYGDWKPVYDENQVEPQNGKDIVTVIDVNIQDVAENALMKHLTKHNATQGCAILMEVSTGHIKAIANLQINPEDGQYKESYNYAIAENVEPGSTFKLISMIALLEDKKISLSDTIDIDEGWVIYHDRKMQDVKKIRDGRITIREAFEKSSNVGISHIVNEAYKDKPEKYIAHIQSLKIDKPLGIEIKGEGKPLVKDPQDKQNWYGTTLPWMSIGYEVMLTPLQLLTLYNAIANDGKMVKPLFVKEIRESGRKIKSFGTVVRIRKICSERTLDSLQSLLEGVVQNGTAKVFKNSIYKIAGKTGTALVADDNRGYNKKIYNSSFVGYFPADDPKYSCIVVVNDPKQGYYYGNSVAAPIFKEIADKVYATHLYTCLQKSKFKEKASMPGMAIGKHEDISNICQILDLPVDTSSAHTDWIVTQPNGQHIKFLPRYAREGIVPNVKGMGIRDAIYLLENLGLKTTVHGRGIIIDQSIKPGTRISKGSNIVLELTIS